MCVEAEIIQDFQDENSYFNYSYCQNVETKEYVVVEKINKEKLRNELSKLVIVDLNKTYEDYTKDTENKE